MPNAPKTPILSVRCDRETWTAAAGNLSGAGTNLSAAVRGFLSAVADADPQRLAGILAAFPPK